MSPSNDGRCLRMARIVSQLGPILLEAERRYRELGRQEPTSVATRQMANDAREKYDCGTHLLALLAAEGAATCSGNDQLTTVSRVFVGSDGNRQRISVSWRCRKAESAIEARRKE